MKSISSSVLSLSHGSELQKPPLGDDFPLNTWETMGNPGVKLIGLTLIGLNLDVDRQSIGFESV